MVQLLFGSRIGLSTLGQPRPDGLKKCHVIADADRVLMGHGEHEGLGQFAHRLHAAILAVLLRQEVLLRGWQQSQAFLGRSGDPLGPVEAMEQAAADLVLLQHHRHRFLLIKRGLSSATAFGVGCQCTLELVGEADVIHHESARLVPANSVDARNGLHQPMAAHRFVHIHGVQTRCIETSEPHVAHQHHPQRVTGVTEPFGQRLATRPPPPRSRHAH